LLGVALVDVDYNRVTITFENDFVADPGPDNPDRRFVDFLVLPAACPLPSKEASCGI